MKEAQFELNAEVEQEHWWFRGRRRILRRLLADVIETGKGHLVIDVGCGTGGNIAALADDYECIGIDTSERGIELARKRFDSIKFICGLAPQDLGDDAGRADALLITDVLEHVEDDAGMLRDLVRSLKGGAHVIVTVPADMRLWSRHDESYGHYRRYDVPMLRRLWQGLDVEAQLVSHFNARLYPLVRVARSFTRLRGRSWGHAETDLSVPPRPANRLLEAFFAGEGRRLERLLNGRSSRGYGFGVSIIAILRKRVHAES